jgi:hypothetical protein
VQVVCPRGRAAGVGWSAEDIENEEASRCVPNVGGAVLDGPEARCSPGKKKASNAGGASAVETPHDPAQVWGRGGR